MMTYFGVKVTIFVSPVLDISICKMNWRRKGKVTHLFFLNENLTQVLLQRDSITFTQASLAFTSHATARASTLNGMKTNFNKYLVSQKFKNQLLTLKRLINC